MLNIEISNVKRDKTVRQFLNPRHCALNQTIEN